MAILGYARVSTRHQTLDQQHDALTAAGCDRIFDDTASGARDDRPGLAALLDYAREGDTVVVAALDRLGRSLAGIVRTVEELRGRGILLRSLREGIDYSTAVGRMVAGVFASLAEYERELIHERAAAARDAARARGKHTGRPRALTHDQVRIARRMREAGEAMPTIANVFGVARSTLYRSLGEHDTADLAPTAG